MIGDMLHFLTHSEIRCAVCGEDFPIIRQTERELDGEELECPDCEAEKEEMKEAE